MTSVDRCLTGFPLNPPFPISSICCFSVFKPSLLMVVLVAIIPAIFESFTISKMSSNCELLRSGAILRRIGFDISFPILTMILGLENQISRHIMNSTIYIQKEIF